VEEVVRLLAAVLLAVLVAAPAFAQDGAKISAAEHEMVAAYGALRQIDGGRQAPP
jgi:hypothetical protein